MLSNFAVPLLSILTLAQPVFGHPLLAPRDADYRSFHRSVAYVQTFTDQNGNWLDLTQLTSQHTGLSHLILASLHLDNPTQIHLNDNDINSTYWDPLWPMVRKLQSTGVKVMLMMGGAAHGSWTNLANDFDTYYPIILQILNDHNLDGFDFDVEEDVSLDVLVKFAKQLDHDLGNDFILTAAPVASSMSGGGNLNNVSWADLDAAASSSDRPNGHLFNWYNTQFYSGFGSPSTASYGDVVNAGWDPSRIVMGVLTSTTAGYGWQSLSSLTSDIASIEKVYPTFGGVYGWEYGVAGVSDNDTPVQWEASIGSALDSRKL